MVGDVLEDLRSTNPVERLLEESWTSRSRRSGRRELCVETAATVLFLAVAVPLAAGPLAAGTVRPGVLLLLIGMYALVTRTIKFPIGAGYVVPSYLLLVPMFVLLPPGVVPLAAASGLVLGTVGRCLARRASGAQLLFAAPDAWHTLGPTTVLLVAGPVLGGARVAVYLAAFVSGCLLDLIVSTTRESLIFGVAPRIQVRVIALVWVVDACTAPLGLLVGLASRPHPALLLFLLPLNVLLLGFERDRTARIEAAQSRLGVLAHERTRLQAAVQRLADAFAAKLELGALAEVVLHGSIDALDAEAGSLTLDLRGQPSIQERSGAGDLMAMLDAVTLAAGNQGGSVQAERGGVWGLALSVDAGGASDGVLAVARTSRPFREDEQALMLGLVERTQSALAKIVAHEALREQALTDPLTGLGNRRKLAEDLAERLPRVSPETPLVLMLFDLDGFKSYNDTLGHQAGDALLTRLGAKLEAAVAPLGSAYRLGGDEFCVLLPVASEDLRDAMTAAAAALEEERGTIAISASCGAVLLPHEASTPDYALQLADKRMYARKHGRPSRARDQVHDVLVTVMGAAHPGLSAHAGRVAALAEPVGRRLGMDTQQLDELVQAADLHEVGVLDAAERARAAAERILDTASALRPIAVVVRAIDERWDGDGGPDGLAREEIPLASRIIAVCDTFDDLTAGGGDRPAQSPEAACERLRPDAGSRFDPAVVDAFIAEQRQLGSTIPEDEASAPVRPGRADDVAERVCTLLAAAPSPL